MGWWIFFGILALLLLLPLGASIFYDALGLRILVIAGPVRFTVFPMKKKEKTEAKKDVKQETEKAAPIKEAAPKEEPSKSPGKAGKAALPEAPKPPQVPEEEPEGGSILDFLPLVELALKFVGEFFHRTLHIDVLYVKLTMAGGDPADLAIGYGNTWAALGNLWPYVDRMFTIKKRDIQVQCDFEGSETRVNARVDITLTLGRLLGLVFGYAFRILVKFLQITWSRNQKAKSVKKNTQTK